MAATVGSVLVDNTLAAAGTVTVGGLAVDTFSCGMAAIGSAAVATTNVKSAISSGLNFTTLRTVGTNAMSQGSMCATSRTSARY